MNNYKIYRVIFICLRLILFLIGNNLLKNNLVIFYEYNFFNINSSELVIVLLVDWIALFFMGVVLLISRVVIFYRSSYMGRDVNKIRFLWLVILFIISIRLIIISPNIVRILLGWDGLGLISYCLVIYYQNIKSYNAGILTILSNRIGDIAILLVISWILNFGGWNFYFYLELIKDNQMIYLIGLLVILAGLTKRAQIPFRSWLPAAIAAPTPVSALVHSSTLVTAGVYLLIRFRDFLTGRRLFTGLIVLGCLTIFISGIAACFENDLKKVIALSTLRQLGLIMAILGIGQRILAFFHLLTHAFFKRLLFLCAGILIHRFNDNQDIRNIGRVVKFIPLVGGFFNFSNLALCGFPFLAGFYSKDLILEVISIGGVNLIIYFLVYFSMGLTVSYTIRLFYWRFIGELNFRSLVGFYSDKIMNKGLYLLFFLRLVRGSALNWLILSGLQIIYLPTYMKLLIIFVTLGGIFVGLISNFSFKLKESMRFKKIQYFIGLIWFMPQISTRRLNYLWLSKGLVLKKNLDYGWLENVLVYNLKSIINNKIVILQLVYINYFKIYIVIFVIWVYLLILIKIIN